MKCCPTMPEFCDGLDVAVHAPVPVHERRATPDEGVHRPAGRGGCPDSAQVECLTQGQQVDGEHRPGELIDIAQSVCGDGPPC